jgi:RNA polymerase sigma factor (TIGR02999 family)
MRNPTVMEHQGQLEATRILTEAVGRDHTAVAADLMPLVYDELRALAAKHLRDERVGHTLQPTALVHEVFLRMVDQSRVDWQGRTHFFAVCAECMRRLLIDHARGRKRVKRGGEWRRVVLDEAVCPSAHDELDVIALHDAVERLAQLDDRQARVVILRFFGGLTVDEVANVLGISKRTVEGDWTHAKAWLRTELSKGEL